MVGAERQFLPFNGEIVERGSAVENFAALGDDFGPDAVAGDYGNGVGLHVELRFVVTSALKGRLEAAVDGSPAAVDEKNGAGDERGRIGSEEGDRTGELVFASPAAESAAFGVRVVPFFVGFDGRGERSVDDAGRDSINANFGSELDGETADKLNDAGFSGGVDALAGLDDERANRGESDDAAAVTLGHDAAGILEDAECAV